MNHLVMDKHTIVKRKNISTITEEITTVLKCFRTSKYNSVINNKYNEKPCLTCYLMTQQ